MKPKMLLNAFDETESQESYIFNQDTLISHKSIQYSMA